MVVEVSRVPSRMRRFLTSLCYNTRGATTIEYAMLCGMIVIAIVAAVRGIGDQNGGTWDAMASKYAAIAQPSTA